MSEPLAVSSRKPAKSASASLTVAVFEKPSRYDLEVKQEAGKLSLARK